MLCMGQIMKGFRFQISKLGYCSLCREHGNRTAYSLLSLVTQIRQVSPVLQCCSGLTVAFPESSVEDRHICTLTSLVME